MKKLTNEQKNTVGMILVIIVIICMAICFQSCTPVRVAGNVTAVNGDTVTVNGYKFRAKTDTVKVGQYVTFTRTVNRKKINSKHIKVN